MSNEEKLVRMLKYVSEHNDFYKKRIKEYGITNPLDITQWPILTRKELQENRYNMFSDGYKNKFFNQQLHRQSSSGSSGVPINVYWDSQDWYISNMSMWRRRLRYNDVRPNDRYVIFTLNSSGSKKDDVSLFVNDPQNVLIVNASLIFERKDELILAKVISDFNPVWLYIQPFLLNRLVEAYIKYSIETPKNLRYIEAVGEILSEDIRKRAMNLFGALVVNFYGSEEFNGIAYETFQNRLEVLEENVVVEILNGNIIDAPAKGEAIITGLNNHAMPLIRYNQQDVISTSKPHTDGSGLRYIDGILGRSYNMIEVGNVVLSSFTLSEAIGEINNKLGDPIIEYKFIYNKNYNSLLCNIALASQFEKWNLSINEYLLHMLKSKFIDANIDIELETVQSICNNGMKHNILEIV